MNISLLRWLALAFVGWTLTVLLSGCVFPGGGYEYDGGGIGAAYYEPSGVDYGGWGPGYQWRRFAAVTIVQPVEVATHLRELTDPRLLPTRCRLFRRGRVLVARDHVEVRPDKDLITGHTVRTGCSL